MSINFSVAKCQDHTRKKLFGLCDDHPSQRAYIDEDNGAKWIAIVENEAQNDVTFTAIDNCIDIKKEDGKMAKRCDGILFYKSTITFVELKERGALGNAWVKDGEQQLRATIGYFEATEEADHYNAKNAYIANKEHPKSKISQASRMEQFFAETGYVLRIVNRIILN